MPKRLFFCVILFLSIFSIDFVSSTEEGIYHFSFSNNSTQQSIVKTLYANSKIFVVLECKSQDPTNEISVKWSLVEPPCYIMEEIPQKIMPPIISQPFLAPCVENHVIIPVYAIKETSTTKNSTNKTTEENHTGLIYTTLEDKIYNFTLTIESTKKAAFNATTTVRMPGPNGYLNAMEYPLLPFYLIMCLVYVSYGIVWLTVSFLQWRDLLRIQFWIGGVIMLGMLEKAIFYAEKQSINASGYSVPEAEITAEIVSCTKRTLARMLVIIMSLGFGIVKPRLGPMLHRVVGVGALYFILAVVDSVLKVKNISEQNDAALVSRIPVAVLDSGICWWIFTSLVQTTRTLRLRRNTVKLNLYRHFTNTLIFSVLISVMFMLYTIATRNEWNCTPGWKNKWFDEAFWHILFSILLLVIMILWRPTNNNQRYAFTPLLDNPEDEDDDDEEDQFVSDVYAIKKRSNSDNRPLTFKATTTEEDDLRWVEENIPSAMAEPALPILDSDEEIINTKFEVSKMQ